MASSHDQSSTSRAATNTNINTNPRPRSLSNNVFGSRSTSVSSGGDSDLSFFRFSGCSDISSVVSRSTSSVPTLESQTDGWNLENGPFYEVEGDIHAVHMDPMSRRLLQAVVAPPLVVDKRVAGLGHLQLKIWSSSARAMTAFHYRATLRVPAATRSPEDAAAGILRWKFDDEELQIVNAQCQCGVAASTVAFVNLVEDCLWNEDEWSMAKPPVTTRGVLLAED